MKNAEQIPFVKRQRRPLAQAGEDVLRLPYREEEASQMLVVRRIEEDLALAPRKLHEEELLVASIQRFSEEALLTLRKCNITRPSLKSVLEKAKGRLKRSRPLRAECRPLRAQR